MPYASKEDFQAHDLPLSIKLVFIGGITLAALAGYVNVIMLGFYHVPVSHMTGAISSLSQTLIAPDWKTLGPLLAIVLGFLAGAICSGIVIGRTIFREGQRYGSAMICQGLLLSLATWLATSGNLFALATAAMACGMQNAMAASFRGLTLRTTHTTGLITDIGVFIGHKLRHKSIHDWKLLLLLCILLGFLAGGILGALCFQLFGMKALAVAAASHLIFGVAYWFRQPHTNSST